MQLKICGSHLTCKVANKCLSVCERVEVVEWNKRWSSPFPCCPVSYQCPWNKTLIEKKSLWSVYFLLKGHLTWENCTSHVLHFLDVNEAIISNHFPEEINLWHFIVPKLLHPRIFFKHCRNDIFTKNIILKIFQEK